MLSWEEFKQMCAPKPLRMGPRPQLLIDARGTCRESYRFRSQGSSGFQPRSCLSEPRICPASPQVPEGASRQIRVGAAQAFYNG
jgi:hypothetical protein